MSIKQNLDSAIENSLYNEIIEGRWAPNERIKIERIMDEYSVSRTPVIQALKRMQERGLVVFTNTGHFYTPAYSTKDLKDIRNLRIVLETRALREIKQKDIDVDFGLLYGICENEQIHSKNGDNILAKKADIDFHKELVDQAGNSILSDLHRRIQDRFMIVNYSFAVHPLKKHEVAYNDHTKLLSLMGDGDFARAENLLEQHITWAYQNIKMYMKDMI